MIVLLLPKEKNLCCSTPAITFALPIKKRSVGQGVKTPPFHGGITGSIPVRSTRRERKFSGFSFLFFVLDNPLLIK